MEVREGRDGVEGRRREGGGGGRGAASIVGRDEVKPAVQ